MKISVDAIVTHRGECCNMEMIFPDCILTCHVYSKGEKFEDEVEVLCRIGDKPDSGNIGRTYQNVISANTSLEEPFESSLPC